MHLYHSSRTWLLHVDARGQHLPENSLFHVPKEVSVLTFDFRGVKPAVSTAILLQAGLLWLRSSYKVAKNLVEMAAVARNAQCQRNHNMILKPCDRGSMAILWGQAKHLAAMTARAEGFETMRMNSLVACASRNHRRTDGKLCLLQKAYGI